MNKENKENKYMTTEMVFKSYKQLEKELKALNIIRKGIHCGWVKQSKDLEDYNSHVPIMTEELTQEEYDLLKEVLL